MLPVDIDHIYSFLKDQGYEPQKQTESHQVFYSIKQEKGEFPVFLRIFENTNALQLIAFLPCTVKKEALDGLGRLLHRLNKEIDLPGFGLDEDSGLVFYRLMITPQNGQIPEEILKHSLKAAENVLDSLSMVAMAVATGIASYQEVLDKLQEYQKQ
jgi:hypothetical protein